MTTSVLRRFAHRRQPRAWGPAAKRSEAVGNKRGWGERRREPCAKRPRVVAKFGRTHGLVRRVRKRCGPHFT